MNVEPIRSALMKVIRDREDAATRTQGFIDGMGAECTIHGLADLPWYGQADPDRQAHLERLYDEAYRPARAILAGIGGRLPGMSAPDGVTNTDAPAAIASIEALLRDLRDRGHDGRGAP